MSEKPNRRPCWRLLCRLLMRSKRVGRTIGARIGRRLPPTTADCCCGYGKLAASRPTRAPILTQSADYASADCVGLQTVGVVGTALYMPNGTLSLAGKVIDLLLSENFQIAFENYNMLFIYEHNNYYGHIIKTFQTIVIVVMYFLRQC